MCGIIGFTGHLDATKVLTKGLAELEYRGYDSAGIAFFENNEIRTIKTAGKVACLKEKVEGSTISEATCGIGHTRWATHGGVSDTNSHPHTFGNVTLIHNGIIENYKELQAELALQGKTPVSQTDTEIAAMIIDDCFDGDPIEAIKKADARLDGQYGFCIMFNGIPGKIFCIRNGSPLVATHTEKGSVIASDMVALIDYSKDYFVLPEHMIATLTADEITLVDLEGNTVEPEMLHVDWDIEAAMKGGYDYFMLKEIHDQPAALLNTITPRIKDGLPTFEADNVPDDIFTNCNRILITACGTAMHAGLVGKNLIERIARVPVTVDVASEFRYNDPIMDEHTLVITISQSGETADTLAAIRLAKEHGAKTLSIVNVKGSTIARESDYVLYTHAGPEIAVASTKAYTVQLSVFYLIAARFALVTNKFTEDDARDYITKLQHAIESVNEVLANEKDFEDVSASLDTAENLFYIGRGLDYCLAMEGSLKLKEISYIHSEAYAAGELKHGTISLITEDMPVIAIATQEGVYSKMISNIREVKARGAKVILITNGDDQNVDESICSFQVSIPKIDDMFAPFTTSVVIQYLAYFCAVRRALNVDQPRNLAKSVTVE
ncbi:MAG: glutamine--fructose-6-phosphate transaminase (isomerizing) [bacterium]|nr:glutamine--fructose-6-phosphate transaminase (isomerizing) [bacterium]